MWDGNWELNELGEGDILLIEMKIPRRCHVACRSRQQHGLVKSFFIIYYYNNIPIKYRNIIGLNESQNFSVVAKKEEGNKTHDSWLLKKKKTNQITNCKMDSPKNKLTVVRGIVYQHS